MADQNLFIIIDGMHRTGHLTHKYTHFFFSTAASLRPTHAENLINSVLLFAHQKIRKNYIGAVIIYTGKLSVFC